MSKDKKQFTKDGAAVPQMQRITGIPEKGNDAFQHLQGGASVPTLQRVETSPEKKGATIPAMQPVLQPAPVEQQSQDTQATGNAGKE